MKFYIGARTTHREKVKEIHNLLKEKGHEITVDWTNDPSLKPYEENLEASKKLAENHINGIMSSDVTIIISDKEGTGIYVELGTAIAQNLIKGKPHIYVIGKDISGSNFYLHPTIKHKENIQEILLDMEKTKI